MNKYVAKYTSLECLNSELTEKYPIISRGG